MDLKEIKNEEARQYADYLAWTNDEDTHCRHDAFIWAFRYAYFLGAESMKKEMVKLMLKA